MIGMIGVGPFITIPVLLAKMNGPQAMLGGCWAHSSHSATVMVWAELGAAMRAQADRFVTFRKPTGRSGWAADEFPFYLADYFSRAAQHCFRAIGFAQYTKFLAGISAGCRKKESQWGFAC